ncbi:hypothetical protein N7485_011036 [Penicillium canescens]|nr:hypothetical protein N7485_011036 [Penicillium canescens]
MSSTYRVRFAPVSQAPNPSDDHVSHSRSGTVPPDVGKRSRSRSGCWQCKIQKLKCDESFPVCLRCRQRGLICKSSPRSPRWQIETRWTSCPLDEIVKQPLLQYWLEKASQMMVIDTENNPYSFPILQYFTEAPSLVHMIQCMSAAHQDYFPARGHVVSLEERGRALQLLQRELSQSEKPRASFLTIVLLALFDCASPDPRHSGQQHLFAARNIINGLLLRHQDFLAGTVHDDFLALCVGAFLYWNMCCAHLVDARQPQPPGSTAIVQAVRVLRHKYHPTYGIGAELIYLLGEVGGYCRAVIQLGHRDAIRATELEDKICAFNSPQNNLPLALLYESLRKHGLILLYRVRTHPSAVNKGDKEEDIIHRYALDIVCHLSEIPITSSLLNLQALPLLTAASELRSCDINLRYTALDRFNAIYSMNRVPSTLQAVEILKELWVIRDSGLQTSWMEFMLLTKGWSLCVG